MGFWVGFLVGVVVTMVILAVVSCAYVSGECSRKEEESELLDETSELTDLEKKTYDKVLTELKKDFDK